MTVLLLSGFLFGNYAAYVWSSYSAAVGALLALWILSVRRRRTFNKTLARLERPSGKK